MCHTGLFARHIGTCVNDHLAYFLHVNIPGRCFPSCFQIVSSVFPFACSPALLVTSPVPRRLPYILQNGSRATLIGSDSVMLLFFQRASRSRSEPPARSGCIFSFCSEPVSQGSPCHGLTHFSSLLFGEDCCVWSLFAAQFAERSPLFIRID